MKLLIIFLNLIFSLHCFGNFHDIKNCQQINNKESFYNLNNQLKMIQEKQELSHCSLIELPGLKKFKTDSIGNDSIYSSSPFWAQEYTGADLASEEIKKMNIKNLTNIFIIDSGFSKKHIKNVDSNFFTFDNSNIDQDFKDAKHGTAVANIIAHPDVLGSSPVAKIVGAKKINNSFFMPFTNVDLVNISMGFGRLTKLKLNFLTENTQTIVVTSAGNKFPENVSIHKKNINNVLIVGSMDPEGFPSYFSQEDGQISIIAPSDLSVTTKLDEFIPFGGTSGAAPQVTAALSNVKALMPYLTHKQAKTLLEKTALEVFTSKIEKTKKVNGHGMLNSYKLLKVAKELKRICYDTFKNKSEIQNCVNRNIKRPNLYKFYDVIGNRDILKRKLEKAFPYCSKNFHEIHEQENNCKNKLLLKQLRASLLLENEDPYLWKFLSCIYNYEGYYSNSKFYLNMSKLSKYNLKQIELAKIALYNRMDHELIKLLEQNPNLLNKIHKNIFLRRRMYLFITRNEGKIPSELEEKIMQTFSISSRIQRTAAMRN